MAKSFQFRINSRPRHQRVQWTLHKYLRKPRIVANRAAQLPTKHSGIRQVVLLIESRQSLAKFKTGSVGYPDTIIPGTGEEKDVREYLVIQRRIMKNQESPWKIWGTTNESAIDKIIGGP